MSKLIDAWQLPLAKNRQLKDFDPAAKPYSNGSKQAELKSNRMKDTLVLGFYTTAAWQQVIAVK